MATTIGPPCIHHYHHSFNRRHSLSSASSSSSFAIPTTTCATTTTTSSLLRLHAFKAHNSLQINNSSLQTNHNPNQQQSRHAPPSTPMPSTSHLTNSKNHLSIPRNPTGAGDSEVRAVLELATNSELFEIEKILFGPRVWGTFLADIVIQMLRTDYIRIVQAIYAFAQIRILRRHGLYLDKLRAGF